MNTIFEKNKLYNYLGDLVDLLKKHKAFVAGGAITSLFCNREIKDIDIYFRTEEDVINFLKDIWHDRERVVSNTTKATQILYDDTEIQLIHFRYFNSAEDIFNTFDFTVCMGCFDFEKEEFVFHPDFIKHNSQRLLKFNSNTAFPIVSLLRVKKYEEKGYTISKPELIRIVMTCMNLEINSYEELKDQLGGMYGINYDRLFEDVENEEFDLQTAIDKIADIMLDETYFTTPEPVDFDDTDIEEIISTILKKPMSIFTINNKKYYINSYGLIDALKCRTFRLTEEIDPREKLGELKIYKFVKKVDNEYISYFKNEFKYKIGEEVVAWTKNHCNGMLYFNQKEDIKNSTYIHSSRAALLEATFNWDDLVHADKGAIMVKKCFITREVPKEEYENWLNTK